MKIAVFHNYYQLRGGEDVMFETECEALQELGHEVVPYKVHNLDELENASMIKKAGVGWKTAYSESSRDKILDFLKREKPDIGHVHNWFPLFSPSIYEAHAMAAVPVVQTLHNYRLGCASGTYRRNGKPCTACIPLKTGPAVMHRCYRNSLIGSLAWKRMVDRNWMDGTFSEGVCHYICPSREVLSAHETMGLPASKMSIIPNACLDPLVGYQPSPVADSEGAVFLGRFVPEKGAEILLKAWRMLLDEMPGYTGKLTLVGTGPEEEKLKKEYGHLPGVRFTGQLPHREAMQTVLKASILTFPSCVAEVFGLGIIEAMAAGRPVVASNIGGPSELIKDGVEGSLVPPDNPIALCQAMKELFSDPQKIARMGAAARIKYERRYTTRVHAENLVRLFERIIVRGPSTRLN